MHVSASAALHAAGEPGASSLTPSCTHHCLVPAANRAIEEVSIYTHKVMQQ